MKEIETGIYETYIPENDAELWGNLDLGGIEKPAAVIARYEKRAIEVLVTHGIVDDKFLVGIARATLYKRADGTLARIGPEYHVEHPEHLVVPLRKEVKAVAVVLSDEAVAVVSDALSLLVQIQIYRHQEKLVEGLALAQTGDKSPELHAIAVLSAHAIKIGELAHKLFKGRPSEPLFVLGKATMERQKDAGVGLAAQNASIREKLNKAVEREIKAAEEGYPHESAASLAKIVHLRLESQAENPKSELAVTLDRIDANAPLGQNTSIPSVRTLRRKVRDLRK